VYRLLRTTLEKNELIAEAIVPPWPTARSSLYESDLALGRRWAEYRRRLETDSLGVREARIVVVPTEKVTRLKDAEKLLTGAAVNDALLKRAGDAALGEVSFLSDAHGSAAYKKELLRVYLSRVVREALS
jgi:carbon-monoxide dehydrogenase medium subunit